MRGQLMGVGPERGERRRELAEAVARLEALERSGVDVGYALSCKNREVWQAMAFLARLEAAANTSGLVTSKPEQAIEGRISGRLPGRVRWLNALAGLSQLKSHLLDEEGAETALLVVPERPEGEGRWEAVWVPEGSGKKGG